MSPMIIKEEDVKGRFLEKEKLYFEYREKEIDEKTFAKRLEDIEETKKNKVMRIVGKMMLLLLCLLSPLLIAHYRADS